MMFCMKKGEVSIEKFEIYISLLLDFNYNCRKYDMNINIKTLLVILFHSTFAFQSCNVKKSPVSNASINYPELDTTFQTSDKDINNVFIDTFQTSLANFISGMDKSYYDSILSIDSDFWDEFTGKINEDFSKIEHRRLMKMFEWSQSSFIDKSIDTSLVFYPFSGPDFLHAHYLYPNANEYILFALEDVGDIPNLKDLDSESTKQYLKNTNNFLRDIYLRSYFITKNMQKDINKEKKVPGVLSTLYWFFSRTDHQIVNVERITLDSNGKLISRDDIDDGIDGVKFSFVKKGEKNIKRLTYFSCDISDKGFEKKNPELFLYLQNIRKCNTFVKSASYLMHYKSFKKIRDIVLDKSLSIFQDDTGVPFKYVDNEDWNIRCFGAYLKPIKDFEKNYNILYQKDLASRYKESTEKLPFSLGYHWKDISEQNQMLITRLIEQ